MPKLTLYRASAGSGKTYTLTREYLCLLLSHPTKYRQILAVTFTNKATAEMKNRILQSLDHLARGKNESLAGEISMALGISPGEVRIRAEERLHALLHDYGRFAVSTIDSFFQKVIRSFARESGLYSGYSIELDAMSILREAVNDLMEQAGEDPLLKGWLVELIEEKIRDGKSWNIEKTFLQFGTHLLEETWQLAASEKLLGFSENKTKLKSFLRAMKGLKKDFESGMEAIGLEALEIIRRNGLIIEDFSQKEYGVAGYFRKISKGTQYLPTKRILDALEDPECWAAQKSKNRDLIISLASSGLGDCLQAAVEKYRLQGRAWMTASMAIHQVYYLGLAYDLLASVQRVTRNENLFLISGTNAFLKKIIDGSDAPFIYERIGNTFLHYMIDEFQDTSLAQWNNFKPLIRESLAGNHPGWIVGDIKQSIYRFRNTDWSILGNLIEKELPGNTRTAVLSYNWRSEPEIILFNNQFFPLAVRHLQNLFVQKLQPEFLDGNIKMEGLAMLETAYGDVVQCLPPGKSSQGKGGLQFKVLDPASGYWKEEALSEMIHHIEFIQELGYPLRSIAILVRTKKEATQIAEAIQQYKRKESQGTYRYDVLSNESLKIGNSFVVQFITGSMQWVLDAGNPILESFLNREYAYFLEILPTRQILAPLSYTEWIREEASLLREKTVYEWILWLVDSLSLEKIPGQTAFIQALEDEALAFSKRESSDIHSFLAYWEENREKKTLVMPEDQDAIQLMTIHKAKGLEFDFVFIPFCDWSLSPGGTGENTSLLWCNPDQEPFNQLPVIPLKLTAALSESLFAETYHKERILSYIDNLNLLYVAFTRAIRRLYVWLPENKKSEGENIAVLVSACIPPEGDPLYGQREPDSSPKTNVPIREARLPNAIEKNKDIALNLFPSSRHFSPRQQKHLDKGTLLHEIFKNLRTPDDLEPELLKAESAGLLEPEDRLRIIQEMGDVFLRQEVQDWFSPKWKVRNEAGIILPSGQFKRPDRVIFNEKETRIIEYKFGYLEEPGYHQQLKEYIRLLRNMGYPQVRGYLWYVFSGKIQEVFDVSGS